MATKKKRLFLVLLFVVTFNYTGNIAAMAMATIERNFKKNKIAWLRKTYPEVVAPKSAIETQYVPLGISQQSTDLLSSRFVELDR